MGQASPHVLGAGDTDPRDGESDRSGGWCSGLKIRVAAQAVGVDPGLFVSIAWVGIGMGGEEIADEGLYLGGDPPTTTGPVDVLLPDGLQEPSPA